MEHLNGHYLIKRGDNLPGATCMRCGLAHHHAYIESFAINRCRATDTLYVGAVINVLAWWTEPRKPIRSAVQEVGDEYITVQPLEGNPHKRMVQISDVINPFSLKMTDV